MTLNPSLHLQPTREEDAEGEVSWLWCSSSARFPVELGLNYASLPPLPHPINNVPSTMLTTASPSLLNATPLHQINPHSPPLLR
ncbi:hypothetical protein CY34DRAFT_780624 [Suillus luteus UH-Slu-Lm8-n1]|uniref:Uncharacterized protein n=1 Tax=Suillus luteus UH-Slu-Lm8-n1 TaxID=930992 RepID=A0A0D0AWC8_9AGAM|nr:hypothetical protein CY34DRAFT_780624 [Suillus luteus UH-Slu-Lm8-n1]